MNVNTQDQLQAKSSTPGTNNIAEEQLSQPVAEKTEDENENRHKHHHSSALHAASFGHSAVHRVHPRHRGLDL